MRVIILSLCLFLLVGCSGTTLFSHATSAELDHHGQLVAVSDDPDVCIVCHDSQAGKEHHRIAVAYPPPGREASFLPVESVTASGSHFLEGKVVCTSCHNLKSREQSHLVVDNSQSRLCLLCHRH